MVEIVTGTVLGDRYTVGRQLGAGGSGVVWQARDGVLDREVALKVVREGVHARLSREARAAARVNHPNVVAVHDAGEDDGRVFVVMELVEGVDLGQVLRPMARWSRTSRRSSAVTSPGVSRRSTNRGSSTATSSRPTCC